MGVESIASFLRISVAEARLRVDEGDIPTHKEATRLRRRLRGSGGGGRGDDDEGTPSQEQPIDIGLNRRTMTTPNPQPFSIRLTPTRRARLERIRAAQSEQLGRQLQLSEIVQAILIHPTVQPSYPPPVALPPASDERPGSPFSIRLADQKLAALRQIQLAWSRHFRRRVTLAAVVNALLDAPPESVPIPTPPPRLRLSIAWSEERAAGIERVREKMLSETGRAATHSQAIETIFMAGLAALTT